jgi:hypothetical protein
MISNCSGSEAGTSSSSSDLLGIDLSGSYSVQDDPPIGLGEPEVDIDDFDRLSQSVREGTTDLEAWFEADSSD